MFVTIILLFIYTIVSVIYSPLKKLKEEDYELIESYIDYEFNANNTEDIKLIIDLFNSNKFYKTIKWVDALASPDIAMTFVKKDGSEENIEIYGGAWDSGIYLVFNNVQYRLKDIEKFYGQLENVFEKIQKENKTGNALS